MSAHSSRAARHRRGTTTVFPFRLALPALGLLLLAGPPPASRAAGHCATHADLSPIAGSPGWFRLGAGPLAARWPEASPVAIVPTYVIRALDHGWDVDGSSETVTDTLVIPKGSTVSWQRVTGIHTLTSGKGADDPDAGIAFDYLLDEQHPRFDSTFTDPDTVEYFCFFHEPRMRGVVIVAASADVPEPPRSRIGFSAPPRPNPSRGTVSFEVGLPRDQRVRIEVLDLLGARVAVIQDGPLTAGNHPFLWRGVTDGGVRARSGVYVIVLRSGAAMTSRRVSLLR